MFRNILATIGFGTVMYWTYRLFEYAVERQVEHELAQRSKPHP